MIGRQHHINNSKKFTVFLVVSDIKSVDFFFKPHLKKLAKLYSVTENDLLPIWLAEKVLQLVENEKYSVQALEMALNKVKDK